MKSKIKAVKSKEKDCKGVNPSKKRRGVGTSKGGKQKKGY